MARRNAWESGKEESILSVQGYRVGIYCSYLFPQGI